MNNVFKIVLAVILILPLVIYMGNTSVASTNSNVMSNDEPTDTSGFDPVDTTEVVVDHIFTYMNLENFMADAIKEGLDSSEVYEHVQRLDGIFIGNLSELNVDDDVKGYTIAMTDTTTSTGIRGAIIIDYSTLSNYDLFKTILYHELGHWFGLTHCDCKNKIMTEEFTDKNLAKILKSWDSKVEELMSDINDGFEGSNFDFPDID